MGWPFPPREVKALGAGCSKRLPVCGRRDALFVVDAKELRPSCLRGGPNCHAVWRSTLLPFLNATVPDDELNFEEQELVRELETGRLVPRPSLDEEAFPPSAQPPAAPPGAANVSSRPPALDTVR